MSGDVVRNFLKSLEEYIRYLVKTELGEQGALNVEPRPAPESKPAPPTRPKGAWRDDPASPKQKEYLKSFGVAFDPDITKGEASRLIDNLKKGK